MENLESNLGHGPVYGSLAYDLHHPELYADEEFYSSSSSAPEPEVKTEAEEQAAPKPRARPAPRAKQGISPFAIAGMLVAAFLTVNAISAQVGLVGVSGENVELQSKLKDLEQENTRLRIEYERSFNLAEVEEYAVETLGMRKPTANQVTYIDTSAPDRAVVISAEGDDTLVDRIADFLSGIGSYFK